MSVLRSRRSWRLGALAAVVATALAAWACGVPTQDTFHAVASEDVPFGLQSPATEAPPTTEAPPPVTVEPQIASPVQLAFVRGDRIVTVERRLVPPVDMADVVEQLSRGPTDSERANGITTFVRSDTIVGVPEVTRGTAVADLNPNFQEDLEVADQVLFFAQIVLTLTGVGGVGLVSFTIGGQPSKPLLVDGSQGPEAVSLDAYQCLRTPLPPGVPECRETTT